MAIEEGADPNGAWTAVIGIIGAVLTLAIIVGLQALYNQVYQDELQRKVYGAVSDQLMQTRADQLATMNSYKWVDQEAGVAGIPIEVAMEKVVTELKGTSSAAHSTGEMTVPETGTHGH